MRCDPDRFPPASLKKATLEIALTGIALIAKEPYLVPDNPVGRILGRKMTSETML
jgi:hypothetical protein